MLRLILAAILAVTALSSASAELRPRPLANAMDAMRAEHWGNALRIAAKDGQVARDVIEWHRLRAGEGRWQDTRDFLARNGDWPGLPWLRRHSEASFDGAPDGEILTFFRGLGAQTAKGALIFAGALDRSGNSPAARAELVKAWRNYPMDGETQARFLRIYPRALRDHHVARLDLMLWKGETSNARRVLELVPDGEKRLAEARMALRAMSDGVDAKLNAVPRRLSSDPGLAYERYLWRIRKGRDSDAADLLIERGTNLGLAENWASQRRRLARTSMRAGKYVRAYQMASQHGLSSGSHFADLEWLSGYLALRFLNRPSAALEHFRRFESAVDTPISLGRAGYWQGRAYEGMRQRDNAMQAYRKGAQYQSSFYGLLAAEKAEIAFDSALKGDTVYAPWRGAPYTRTSVHKAAILLLASGERSLAERFWVHLAETWDEATLGQMARMAQELGEPHIAVMLGKRAVKQDQMIEGPYYALHPMADLRLPVRNELALSIARRESEFDPTVVSPVGALGMMQVMPKTGQALARDLGLEWNQPRMLSDPNFNITLGAKYLADLGREFRGNILLVSAAYNAGPSRAHRWSGAYGDPRNARVDVVDWIEHIPFRETRNYVMRVAESMPIYRARLGKVPLPQPFSQELQGSSALPLSP